MTAAEFLLLFLMILCSSGSTDQKKRTVTAEPGQNIVLPCRAADSRPVTAVEWTRTDLKTSEYVLLYRDQQMVPFYQHSSFRNRVDLQDRTMTAGDVSLVLNNVRSDDTGTYECRVFQAGTRIRKRANLDSEPISTIYLDVSPDPFRSRENRNRGNMDGWNQLSRNRVGSVGPSAGLVLLFSVLLWVW
ncbi:hepatitis A virus cellular receptor 2 homolog [Fundulus heteroclitus]|uniref:hepatitis A virus cellular receptor 2 homolog n=1 Tax=Fundulus heteroclitus TaxID=8078 RepID=UPI00165A5103|nr:hepatitis A virus cellular receptor 2 homolog [Fundulus heteroclitus]